MPRIKDQRGVSLVLVLAVTAFMSVILGSLVVLTQTGFETVTPVKSDREVNYALSSALDAAIQQGRTAQAIGRGGYCPGESLTIKGAATTYSIDVTCQPVPQTCLFYERTILYVATANDPSHTTASVIVTFHDDFGDPGASQPVTSTDIGIKRFSTGSAMAAPTTTTCGGGGGPANVPPTAAFTSTTNGLIISVDGSTSADDSQVVAWAWDYGDGTTGTGVTATHTYAASGTYAVKLTVTDDQGATNSVTQPVTVIANVPPVAAFTVTTSGLTANVDGSTSTDDVPPLAAWAWDFGDGTTGTGVTASHAYSISGTYTIKLTVTDGQGATNSTTHAVSVVAPSTAVYSWWRGFTADRSGSNWTTSAQLAVTDQNTPGLPRPGATATLKIETSTNGTTWTTVATPTITMGADGTAWTTTYGPYKRSGNGSISNVRYTVTAVSSGGLPWLSAASEKVLVVSSP